MGADEHNQIAKIVWLFRLAPTHACMNRRRMSIENFVGKIQMYTILVMGLQFVFVILFPSSLFTFCFSFMYLHSIHAKFDN